MEKIGFNKKLNRLPIYFEKEIFVNAFGWLLKEFNKWNKGLEIKERVITIKKREIWEASTTRPYTKEEFSEFIRGLTVSKRYEIDKEKGISGKYAKRLYMLLKQFESTGYFIMDIEQFCDVLEVPKTYTLGRINDKIIKPAKAELEKKQIYRFPGETKGKGRRKIEKIEIYFSIFEAETTKKKKLELSLEEEVEAREILQKQGIGYEILNEQKKKSPSIYIKTLKSVLKK